MRVKVTLTKVTDPGKTAGRAIAGDYYIEGAELEFYSGEGALLAVKDRLTGRIYQTDFAWASAITALDAAKTVADQWVLT